MDGLSLGSRFQGNSRAKASGAESRSVCVWGGGVAVPKRVRAAHEQHSLKAKAKKRAGERRLPHPKNMAC